MIILVILLLILLNFYFSLAEIALIAVKQGQLTEEAEKGNKKAKKALQLSGDPEAFLSAVQVGITLLGILEGIYGGEMVASKLDPFLVKHFGWSHALAHIVSTISGIGLITYLTIVIGELLPKSIALQLPLKVSILVAPSLLLFSRIAFPFVKLLTISTRFLLDKLHIHKQENEKISENDLRKMLSTAYNQGILDKDELVLHENIFSYSALTAKRIMKPAKIVISIPYESTRDAVMEIIRTKPYSHFPVKKTDGSISGILSTKNFALNTETHWHTLIRPFCQLTPEMDATAIFLHFKKTNNDFGLVMKSNHFLGIVAMQDIMEGVFGDMPEREDYRDYFYKESDNTWIAEGFIHLQRIKRELSLDWMRAYENKYVTITELLEGELGHWPQKGEQLTIENLIFNVEESEQYEIGKVLIRKVW
jgi:putative hemolysin